MFYVRRCSNNNYLYYMNGDSVSFSDKLKDAIPFEDLEVANAMRSHLEHFKKENFEVVSVITTITVIEDQEKVITINSDIEEHD